MVNTSCVQEAPLTYPSHHHGDMDRGGCQTFPLCTEVKLWLKYPGGGEVQLPWEEATPEMSVCQAVTVEWRENEWLNVPGWGVQPPSLIWRRWYSSPRWRPACELCLLLGNGRFGLKEPVCSTGIRTYHKGWVDICPPQQGPLVPNVHPHLSSWICMRNMGTWMGVAQIQGCTGMDNQTLPTEEKCL